MLSPKEGDHGFPSGTWPGPGGGLEAVRIRLLGGFRVSVGIRSIGEEEWRLKKAGVDSTGERNSGSQCISRGTVGEGLAGPRVEL